MESGIILLNKESNISSRSYCEKCAKKLGFSRFGHTGTLDPLASGLLVMLLGSATKLNDYLNSDIKGYIATFKLGFTSETFDIEGKNIEKIPYFYDEKALNEAINTLKKQEKQVPPIYSAIKKNGKKLYQYALNNEDVELEERDIKVYELELLEHYEVEGEHYIKLKMLVSKGYYVRSLANDLGKLLNSGAIMTELCRYKAGLFDLENAYSFDDLVSGNYSILSVDEVFDLPSIDVDLFIAKKIGEGLVLDQRQFTGDSMFKVKYDNHLIAIYKPHNEHEYKMIWKDGEYLASL